MKKKILAGLLGLILVGSMFGQTGNPPGIDMPIYQSFILSSNGVNATATTNAVAGSNLWLVAGAETATFWVSSVGNLGSVAASGNKIYISPISVGRFGTNNTTTNVCSWQESPIVLTQSPLGMTNCIKATNFNIHGIEGFVVQAQVNTSGGGLTNTVWMTYRVRPK